MPSALKPLGPVCRRRAQNCLSHGLNKRLIDRMRKCKSALFIAIVMTWMISGGNDAFEKSFMPPIQPSQVVHKLKQARGQLMALRA